MAIGLVGPLALGPTTFEQRATLVVLVMAVLGSTPVVRVWRGTRPVLALALAGSVGVLLIATAPAAAEAERVARGLAASREGERLLELSRPEAAETRFEAAASLDRRGEVAQALAALRRADAIWNEYEWPRTIDELRRAYEVLHLPRVAEKLYAAEMSYAVALFEAGDVEAARRHAEAARQIDPGRPEAGQLLERLAVGGR